MKKRYVLFYTTIFFLFTLSACQSKQTSSLVSPFTSLDWKSNKDDVISTEGDDFSTYPSLYGGDCYTYPKEYDGYNGLIKYMFDDNGALKSVAWTYSANDADELNALYNAIYASIQDVYGESSYSPNGAGNYGAVWKQKSGNVILSAVSAEDGYLLQYSYLHPDVSTSEENE